MNKNIPILWPAILVSLAGAQTFRLVDLGTLGGQSNAFALSASGETAGTATKPDSHFVPVRFSADGAPEELPALAPQLEHVVFGFDPLGRPIGTSYTLGNMDLAAFRIEAAGPTLLGAFAARACNAAGDIAGSTRVVATDGLTLPVACLYRAGTLIVLPSLGGRTSQALGLDDLGRAVGSASTAGEAAVRPCIWTTPTRAVDLGTLGGPTGQAAASRDDGSGGAIVVGHSVAPSDGLRHATRWRVNAAGVVLSRSDLGILRPGTSSFALAQNATGDAVGTSDFRAVLFRAGAVLDLNQLLTAEAPGWVLESAAAINDTGQIVGTGTLLGFPRAFMLEPFRCFADFNQDGGVDGADVEAFFTAWESGQSVADVNADGGVDGSDVDTFFAAWESGSCN